jgi:hypothetical protein
MEELRVVVEVSRQINVAKRSCGMLLLLVATYDAGCLDDEVAESWQEWKE